MAEHEDLRTTANSGTDRTRIRRPPTATDVLRHLHSRREAFLRLLRDLTQIESPSDQPDAQPAVREV
ncbi:MAG: hypothetical protein RQ826_11790, partial [Xanthomonadales bacterium]|nr:hypothetical protein [Xanthomonadales bacterium]